MSNLVLYRKYRPQLFSEIIGQEHIVQTLTNAISFSMISHAYLFCGPRGSGKTTIARLLAKAVNCSQGQQRQRQQPTINSQQLTDKQLEVGSRQLKVDVSPEPCNKCSSCLEIMQGNSIDLIEIDAASNRGIDEMRELRDGIKFAPTKSKYKVFIIDESHQLTKEAANALLKTLEEPPKHAIFILATTEIHKMIPTIISRCQRFDFKKLTLQEITKRLEVLLKKEDVKVEKSALELIALNSGGSIRDAESSLDQVLSFIGTEDEIKTKDIKDLLGIVEIGLIIQFCDFVVEKKPKQAINFLNEIIEKGLNLQEFTKALINYLRQGLILKIVGEDKSSLPRFADARVTYDSKIITGLTNEQIQKLKEQAALLKEQEICRIINLFMEAENKIKYSSIPQLPLELAVIEAVELER